MAKANGKEPADPWAKLRDAAIACGLNPKLAEHVVKRFAARKDPNDASPAALKKLTNEILKSVIDDRLARIFDFMDDAGLEGGRHAGKGRPGRRSGVTADRASGRGAGQQGAAGRGVGAVSNSNHV